MIAPGIYSDDIIANDRFSKYFDSLLGKYAAKTLFVRHWLCFATLQNKVSSGAYVNRGISNCKVRGWKKCRHVSYV
ncbi:MAG: hypothetical protein WCC17_20865 [Candidatus Nitrosopolaris sp.]